MSLAEAIVILKMMSIQYLAMTYAVYQHQLMTAHSHQSMVWQNRQRLYDIVALCVEYLVEMAEIECIRHQVRGHDLIDTTAFSTYIQPPFGILHDIHRCTTTQTAGTLAFTLMQPELHLIGILFYTRYPQAVTCSC